MIAVQTKWARIRLRYPLNDGGGCTNFDCYGKRGVVILRAYDEKGRENYLGGKCQSCLEEWLKAYNLTVFDIEDMNAF